MATMVGLTGSARARNCTNSSDGERPRKSGRGRECAPDALEGIDPIRLMVYNIGMTKVSTAVARKRFSDVVNRASYAKERVALTRYGHTMAAIVPAEDLDLLEAMENRIDADDARKVLADMKAKGEKPIPLAKVKKRLGL